MSKRKNPFANNDTSPPKKRKVDETSISNQWCITLTTTQNVVGKEASFSINNQNRFKVGRDPKCCSIVFSADTPMVSRVHCEFIFNDNTLFIKDLNSTNGVFVNNAKIEANDAFIVFPDDIIRFGKKYKNYNHEYKISIQIHQTAAPIPSTKDSLLDIQNILQQTVAAQLAEHSKKMEQKLAAKEEESRRIKQQLHDKEMAELAQKAQKQREELEHKQKEMDLMRETMERNKLEIAQRLRDEKLKIEQEKQIALQNAQQKQQEELVKIAEKERVTQQQELEAQRKIKQIEEARKKLDEEKAKQQNEILKHKKRMEMEEQKMKEKELALKEQELKVEELNNNTTEEDMIEEETTCCMCYDILLAAHSLECGHTMCHQCIREWIDENKAAAVCPICRAQIKCKPTPCRTLDNIIDNIYFKNKPEEAKKEYADRKKEYKAWKVEYEKKSASNHNNNNNNNNHNAGNAGFNWAAWADHNHNVAAPVDVMDIDDDSEEEEEEEYIPDVSYSVENARSGRSTCRSCWTRIEHASLRFGVYTEADPLHGQYYETTHWYHPRCFGTKYKNDPSARRRGNISNHAGLSVRALERKLEEIFASDEEEESESESEESSSDDDVPVRVLNANRNNERGAQRTMQIGGINFRARMNRLENLTVNQLKKYTAHNNIYVPSSMRKAALCAMIRRDIVQHRR